MEHTLEKIESKPNDYKICTECGKLNWYENKRCVNCENTHYTNDQNKVLKAIASEYEFYTQQGYDLEEIDFIETQV